MIIWINNCIKNNYKKWLHEVLITRIKERDIKVIAWSNIWRNYYLNKWVN